MQPLIALVDCNNFYASCERLFRPDLINKPVAVLSNNDGCIVARSAEVKALGIKMGTPAFKVRHLIEQHRIQLFSSNYSLYADISARVMSVLEEFAPGIEIYSIDEAFLDLTGICHRDSIAYAQRICQTVQRDVGIPVCVGMGPTKTLAKLANFAAKKWKKTGGVLDLSEPERLQKLMKIVPVGEVWGIGSRTAKKLNQIGVLTAWDLSRQPLPQLRSNFNVVIARTAMELNGIACLSIEEIAPDKQQIVCSRSFKQAITAFDALSMQLTRFCIRAAEKLRRQKALAQSISVFIRTSPFKPDQPYYERSATHRLAVPSQDSRYLAAVMKQALQSIYRPGFGYQKAGVQLSHFQPAAQKRQLELFSMPGEGEDHLNNMGLMSTMDQINRKFPKALTLGSSGLKSSISPSGERISPCYTTRWQDIPSARC